MLRLALFVATVDAVLERPPRRLQRPAAADREAALLAAGRGACPVLCVDALPPYQRPPRAAAARRARPQRSDAPAAPGTTVAP